jgi:DNA-binding transcriptional LysR family regulator
MDIDQLDLNLLRVFHQLMTERRVSSVAETLGMSQPAVSGALRRLREALGDELFLRTARGMQPTPLAESLAAPVASAIATLRGALSQPARFEPASARRAFRLSLTDIGEIYFLPPLLARLDQLAPGIDLATARNSLRDLRDEMESGRIDAAIGLLPQLQGRFYRQRLFRQPYVLAMREGHPLLKRRKLGVTDFSAAEHVVVLAEGTGSSNASASRGACDCGCRTSSASGTSCTPPTWSRPCRSASRSASPGLSDCATCPTR